MLQRLQPDSNQGPTPLAKASPILFVLSGPSGVGKDALAEQLRQHEPYRHYAITATSRDPRVGEKDGVHYHFRSEDDFRAWIDTGELLEWAKVYGHYYGVPKSEVRTALRNGLDVVLKVDVQGAATVKKLVPQAVLIFIAPYAPNELVQRHFRRHTEGGWELNIRLETAQQEMQAMSSFDYVVINKQGDLARTVAQVEAIITAEKSRVHPPVFSL